VDVVIAEMKLIFYCLTYGILCKGDPVEDCELSFLQTERTLSQRGSFQPNDLEQAIPEWFAHAAPQPYLTERPAISTEAILALGLGTMVFLLIIVWSFNEEPVDETKHRHHNSPHFWRKFIAFMILMMYLLNYADRYNIAVAIIRISDERGYDKRVQGLIQSVVYMGYLPGTVCFGHLASPDVLGPYCAAVLACTCWSVATLLTPLCADSSLGLLLMIRIFLGFFEAASAPSTYQLAHQWFPKLQAGHLLASGIAGQCAGAAIANAFGPMEDWRIVFYIFGVCGLLWCTVFLILASDVPATHRYVSQEERDAIEELQDDDRKSFAPTSQPIPLLSLMRHSSVRGLMIAEFCYSFLWYFWLSWMPSFFHDAFGLSVGESGVLGLVSYAVAMPAPFLWSKVFGTCFQRNGPSSLLKLRMTFVVISFLGAALANSLMLLTFRHLSAVGATLLVMPTILVLCAKVVGTSGLLMDMGGEANSARVGGLMHIFSAISGSLSNVIVGYFLNTPSLGYTGVFILTTFLSLFGLAVQVTTGQVEIIQPGDCEDEALK